MIQHRAKLIQKVTTVMAIVDSLGKRVHPELYAEIQAEMTRQKQMRRLYLTNNTIITLSKLEFSKHLQMKLGNEAN